jgi:putative endonuclease
VEPDGYDHLRLGAWGEARVARWYEARGYDVLDRNWRCPEGELDLVLAIDDTVVFCEVKTRSSNRKGRPQEAVGWDKRRRIRALALRWLGDRPDDVPRPRHLRFDVAAVTGGRIEVLQAAF